MSKQMLKKQTWEEFQDSGLLWWVNRSLHLFGWAIVFDHVNGKLTVYPARTRFRGFGEMSEEQGFIRLTKYMKRKAAVLLRETED